MLQATQLGQVQPPMLQHLGSKVCTFLLLFASSICSFKARLVFMHANVTGGKPLKMPWASSRKPMVKPGCWGSIIGCSIWLPICNYGVFCPLVGAQDHHDVCQQDHEVDWIQPQSAPTSDNLEAGVQLLNRHAPS